MKKSKRLQTCQKRTRVAPKGTIIDYEKITIEIKVTAWKLKKENIRIELKKEKRGVLKNWEIKIRKREEDGRIEAKSLTIKSKKRRRSSVTQETIGLKTKENGWRRIKEIIRFKKSTGIITKDEIIKVNG